MTLIMPLIGRKYWTAAAANGVFIRSACGREWIDGSSGAIACSIGHSHPAVLEAVRAQMETATFLYRTQFANVPAQRLAERLCAKLGYEAAFFVNSGSEAVETAARLAQQFWRESGRRGKTRVLSRKISYHGSTSGALALSGHWPRRRAFAAELFGEPTLPTPYPLRRPAGQDPASYGLDCARAVEEEILRLGADNIAGILVEPIVGASGAAIVPPPGYLKALRKICDDHNVLLISDEVLTGLGRTGRWLAMEHDEVKADIVCLGKGVNGGYLPISGVLASARIYDLLRTRKASFVLGHTHSNHPVAAAAANAVLDVLESEDLVSRAASAGAYLGDQLRAKTMGMPIVAEVRGKGMLWGLELVRDNGALTPHPAELKAADRTVDHAFDLGLVIYPSSGFISGSSGDAIIVAPPLNTSQSVLDVIVERVVQALQLTEQDVIVDQDKIVAKVNHIPRNAYLTSQTPELINN